MHTLRSVQHGEVSGEGVGVRVQRAAKPASPFRLFGFSFVPTVAAEQRALLHRVSKGAKLPATPRTRQVAPQRCITHAR